MHETTGTYAVAVAAYEALDHACVVRAPGGWYRCVPLAPSPAEGPDDMTPYWYGGAVWSPSGHRRYAPDLVVRAPATRTQAAR